MDNPTPPVVPSLRELGLDLVQVSRLRRLISLAAPFFWCGAYFAFAALGWWLAAIFALAALTFVTYGSTSHDLVHGNLGLPRAVNDVFLCLIELLTLRSGHAYRAAHLHHHARYPETDDVEGAAARMSFFRTLAEGVVFQGRIWWWAVRHSDHDKVWILGEGAACIALFGVAVLIVPLTPVLLVYVVLLITGSWLFPLITSYVPHTPDGENELFQTRAFRGVVASLVAFEHLYHLEHHLYPAVPHHNWSRLARRLDPYFAAVGVKPIKILF